MSRKQLLIISVVICAAGIMAAFLYRTGSRDGRYFGAASRITNDSENPFAYPLDSLLTIDSGLIGYYQIDSTRITVGRAESFCIGPDSSIYVADERGVHRFNTNGVSAGFFRFAGGLRSLAFDNDGRLHGAKSRRIIRFGAEGTIAASWIIGEANTYITSITFGEKVLFAADAGMRIVWCLDTNGTVTGRIGKRDTTLVVDGFIVPSPYMDLTTGQDGSLWVVNPGRHRIENYRSNGELLYHWGKPGVSVEGFCGCCNPVRMALLPDGSFVTVEKGIIRVKAYGPTGKFRCVVAPPSLFHPENGIPLIATQSNGNILLLDMQKKLIRIFQRKTEGTQNG